MIKVRLVSFSHKPLETMCRAISIMKDADPEEYVQKLSQHEKEMMIREILKTRLRGALEFASLEFDISGVTRAFTHQLVRHRAFHFSQQSMRFFDASDSSVMIPLDMSNKEKFEEYVKYVNCIMDGYKKMIEMGIAIQDARGILPTNVTTRIMFGCTFRGLVDLAEVRMCQQTQGEFREVMQQLKKVVETQVMDGKFLSTLLVPVCDRSGKCEFKSIYDRPCPKQGGSYDRKSKD